MQHSFARLQAFCTIRRVLLSQHCSSQSGAMHGRFASMQATSLPVAACSCCMPRGLQHLHAALMLWPRQVVGFMAAATVQQSFWIALCSPRAVQRQLVSLLLVVLAGLPACRSHASPSCHRSRCFWSLQIAAGMSRLNSHSLADSRNASFVKALLSCIKSCSH